MSKEKERFFTPRHNRIKNTPGDKVFVFISNFIVLLIAFLCFYPFYYIVINSIVTLEAARQGVYIFPMPGQFFFDTYVSVIKKGDVTRGMMVSGLRVLVGVSTNVVFSSMFAYLVSRPQLPFRKVIYRYMIISMYVGGGLIPWFLLMRSLGLINNFAVYWVPGMLSVWNAIMVKTYMENAIGIEMEESARIDGAGFIRIFFQIMMPLSKPILATIALWGAVGTWNTYFDNYILVSNPKLQTVQMELFNYVRQAEQMQRTMQSIARMGTGATQSEFRDNIRLNMTANNIRNVTTIIAIAPIMVIYPFLQKYFARGIMMGAIKG